MRENPLHILFTTAWYPNRMEPGDGVFIEKHAQAIARGNRVSVLLVKADYAVRVPRIERESSQEGNLLVERIYVPKVRFEWPVVTGILRFLLFLAGSLYGYLLIRSRRGRPDISHVNVLTRAGLLPYLLKRCAGIPYIITEHWTRYQRGGYPRDKVQHWLTRRIVRSASFVAPVSTTLGRDMERTGLESAHYTTVNNVVDTKVFAPQREPMVRQKKRMIHVSWMRDPAKNISGILRAAAELHSRRDDFQLVLVGEGNDKPALMKLAGELGLTEVVTFLPDTRGGDLAREIGNSDFMVLFSNFENQPVCILEALSCGIPVLATRVGAVEEMLGEGRGVVIDAGDAQALVEKMEWMLDHHAGYDPVRLHEYADRAFSPRAVQWAYERLYEESLLATR